MLAAAFALTCLGNPAAAGDAPLFAVGVWQHMPVFHDGRVMPLDTFARGTVTAICGRPHPVLSPADDAPDASAALRDLFPGGKPRRFAASELLLSWLLEPDVWERVPLVKADDPQLREAMGWPLADHAGRRLRYVSPSAIQQNEELGRRWEEIQARFNRAGGQMALTGLDKKIQQLVDAYERYRQLTFDPQAAPAGKYRFLGRIRPTIAAWQRLAVQLQQTGQLENDKDLQRLGTETGLALHQLITTLHSENASADKIEAEMAKFRRAVEQLTDRLVNRNDHALAALAAELRRQTIELHLAFYDNGNVLRLTPSLNPAALEEKRASSDDAQPWLSLQALLQGSAALLHAYPEQDVQAVRTAFAELKTAYAAPAAERQQQLTTALNKFSAAVRTLGQDTTPLRDKLPLRHRDADLLAATAYPAPGSTNVEVFYNRLDPFFWSWTVSLAAVVCLAFSWGRLRQPLFWLGVLVLLAAQAFTLIGFGIRMDVTGLVPLTGMFETVVFVALGVALLGLGFAVLPLFAPGLRVAWALTAFFLRPAADGMNQPHGLARGARGGLLLLRIAGMAAVALIVMRWPWMNDWGLFDLWPQAAIGAVLPSLNDLLVWFSGLCIAAATIYYVPRCTATLLAGVVVIPQNWRREGLAAPLDEVMRRRLFVLGGAIMASLTMALAYYAPATVMKREIGSVSPILRDNHWLVVHVVTIMASYAAAAIALVLGNVTLGYYLFGHYRDEPLDAAAPRIVRRRPPAACATLAGFTYTAVKITVLLLAAGTILGALWADKSWGRFWSWDPKEVWALISLLVYALILHARRAGWAGNFGMAATAVLGAGAVLFTWYGVNFILGSGMHAYGSGSSVSGQWQLLTAAALNVLFVAAAALRYLTNCGDWQDTASPSPPTAIPPAAKGTPYA